MKTIYVAGPYTGANPHEVACHARIAYEFAIRLWKQGWGVFTPHYNTLFMETREIPYESFMKFDFIMIQNVDALFMLPGWKDSKGATREHGLAKKLGKPIFYDLNEAKRYLVDNLFYLEE